MKVVNACVRALLRRKRCVRHRLPKGVLFVATRVCPLALLVRCYSGSRDQLDIDQDREYISVNGKAAFSSLQTMWGRWRLVGVQVQYPAERSTSSR